MLIKESDLRQIVKEELLNEFFGSFRKRKPKKISHTGIHFLFKKLEEVKNILSEPKISDIHKEEHLDLDSFNNKEIIQNKILDIGRGIDIFLEEIFPVISSLGSPLKESDVINIREKDKFVVQTGYIFLKHFSGLLQRARLKSYPPEKINEFAREYYSTLNKVEKNRLESVIQFYSRVFRYLKKVDVNKIIEDRLKYAIHPEIPAEPQPSMGEFIPSKPPPLPPAGRMTTSRDSLNVMNFEDLIGTGK